MSRVALGRVGAMACAGALGGVLTFVLVNPTMVAQEAAQHLISQGIPTTEEGVGGLGSLLLLGGVLGMAVGAALIISDEIRSRNPARLLLYTVAGLIAGALFGCVGSIVGQMVFRLLLAVLSLGQQPAGIALILSRTIGWSLLGAAAGICPGVVARSMRRVLQGIVGGLVGGAAGGLAFDRLGDVGENGSLSRAVGFVLIGTLVGALVSLVEEVGKEYWLTALTGAREGRAFILAKNVTLLGRSELADVPLFGDTTVQKLHAQIVKTGAGIYFAAAPGLAVTVNNLPVANAALADGDILGIGGHRFRFRSRRATVSTSAPIVQEPFRSGYPQNSGSLSGSGTFPDRSSTYTSAMSPPFSPSLSRLPPVGIFPSAGSPEGMPGVPSRLMVVAGPHTGSAFALTPNAIIGRDPRCDIALIADSRTSRQHARLHYLPSDYDPNSGVWQIEDGGSTNGLIVNGVHVTTHQLQIGDELMVGDSVLRID